MPDSIPIGAYTKEIRKYWPLILRILSLAYSRLRELLESLDNRYEIHESTRQDLKYFLNKILGLLRGREIATFAICDDIRGGRGSLTRAIDEGYRLLRRRTIGRKRCDLLMHIGLCSILLIEYTTSRRKSKRPEEILIGQVKDVYDLYVQLKERNMLNRWIKRINLSIKANLDSTDLQRDFNRFGGLAIIVTPPISDEFTQRHVYESLYVGRKPRRGRLSPYKNPYVLFLNIHEVSQHTLNNYFMTFST